MVKFLHHSLREFESGHDNSSLDNLVHIKEEDERNLLNTLSQVELVSKLLNLTLKLKTTHARARVMWF